MAIVTGASPNIGGVLAGGLAAAGAAVLCTDISPTTAEATAESIRAKGGTARWIAGDVTDEAHAREAVALACDAWGKVDILINNAVIFNQKGVLTMPTEEFRRQVEVILVGALNFTREVAESMIAASVRGSIINLLSTAAWQGQPGNIGYSTAKSGMINFTRSAAMELAEYGIRVNGFTPTATAPDRESAATPLTRDARAHSKYYMDFVGQTPLGRLPVREDYVPAVVFLASDDSAMITGSNITVDGGATAKYWPWVPGMDVGSQD